MDFIIKLTIDLLAGYIDLFASIVDGLAGRSITAKHYLLKKCIKEIDDIGTYVFITKDNPYIDLPEEYFASYFKYKAVYGTMAFLKNNCTAYITLAYSNSKSELESYCEKCGYSKTDFYEEYGYFIETTKYNIDDQEG